MTRVPVERLQPGAVIVLLNGKHVRVDEVRFYPEDDVYVVHWSLPQTHYHDGVRIEGGRREGLLRQLRAGDKVQVDENAREEAAA